MSEEALKIPKEEEKQKAREKGKDIRTECRVPENSRKDKKAFVNEQCKEVEENNRMGKTRDLFKEMGYEGNISCRDGHDKGQKW